MPLRALSGSALETLLSRLCPLHPGMVYLFSSIFEIVAHVRVRFAVFSTSGQPDDGGKGGRSKSDHTGHRSKRGKERFRWVPLSWIFVFQLMTFVVWIFC